MYQYASNNCPINTTPTTKAELTRSPKIMNLNYTCQDFWSLKTKLVAFIKERFGPSGNSLPNTFNDFVESDIAIMLIENWAFIGDLLSFKVDQLINELFIDTVTETDNAFRLAKLVGFNPTPPIPSKTMWTATLTGVVATDVVVPAPHIISTAVDGKTIYIELYPANADNEPIYNEDIIIPSGSTTNSGIVGFEGRTLQDTIVGTGDISQNYLLANSPVIYDSVNVEIDGIQWEHVEYFTDSTPRREFRTEFNSDYQCYVVFGNNRAGIIPAQGSTIRVTYRVGGGTIGNIISDYLEQNFSVPAPGLGFFVPITIRNYTRGQNGYDGDTIEDVRNKLPLWIKTQDRAVSGADYKTLCDQFITAFHGQIGKSSVILRNHGCAGNIVDIYVLSKDGVSGLEKASNELKVALSEELDDKKMITDYICIRDGTILYTDVSVEVIADKFYAKFQEEIKAKISQRIDDFFALSNWEYGQTLRDSDLFKQFSDVKQSSNYNIQFTTDDPDNSGTMITSHYYEIIRPDTVTISFTYT